MSAPDVAIVGGGAIGLAIAWRAASAGMRVSLIDDAPGSGASSVAAGMLAPVTEVHYGEEPLLALNLAAARAYPGFVQELEDAAGSPVGYQACGTLSVAFDADDVAVLDDLHAFQSTLGLPVRRLSGRECRDLEPMLAPPLRSGMLADADHRVDNRLLVAALVEAARRAGVTFVGARAQAFLTSGDRVSGLLLEDGRTLATGSAVLAAGSWSGSVDGLPPATLPAVRPVKGQLLVLRGPASPPLLGRNVRGLARGQSVYLVPRDDGRVVVGATVEERGFDTRRTADAARTLLRDAHQLVPGVDELELLEHAVGLRPGSPDNAPLLGTTEVEGLLMATGHYRNGILLTPVTADTITTLLVDGEPPELISAFAPTRFSLQSRCALAGAGT
ncbi:MAG: glycine oxidase ThiO [Candidatus Dormibacteria bacterium]